MSASEVLQKAMRARSSGRTLAAEVTLTIRTNDLWATQAQYEVDHYDMLMRADGSFRLSRRGPSPVGWSMGGSDPSAEVASTPSAGWSARTRRLKSPSTPAAACSARTPPTGE